MTDAERDAVYAESRRLTDEAFRSACGAPLLAEVTRLGLSDSLEESLAEIAAYTNISDEQREVCRQNAIMTASLDQTLKAPERPLARVLEFKPRLV